MKMNKFIQACVVSVFLLNTLSHAEDYQADDIADIPDAEDYSEADDISELPDVEEFADENYEEADDLSNIEDAQEFSNEIGAEADNVSDIPDTEAQSIADTSEKEETEEVASTQQTSNEETPQPNQQAADAEVIEEESTESSSFFAIEEVELKPEDIFKNGYEHFKAEKWQLAAGQFLKFIQLTDEDEKNYEWAEFFMAISLDNLGYTHAAVDRFSNLAARKPNTKIVSYILDMFEKISRSQPFDYDQVILQVVNDKDYGFISDDISGFVDYYQGIQDWKTGYKDWAQDHFKRIPADSYYYGR